MFFFLTVLLFLGNLSFGFLFLYNAESGLPRVLVFCIVLPPSLAVTDLLPLYVPNLLV